MASNKILCGGCQNIIEDRRFLLCGGCKQHYDLICANVSEQRFYNTLTTEHKAAWRCAFCKSKQPKLDNSNTPVRAASEGITFKRGAAVNSPTDLNMSIVDDLNDTAHNVTIGMGDFQAFVFEMRSFRQEMRDELRANRLEIKQLNDSVGDLLGRVNVCEEQIKRMDERINELELSLNKERTNSTLSASIEHLKAELNERDQDLLLNDVEISCIQEQKGENLLNVVTVLAAKLGMNLAEQDIVSATRVGRAPERESEDKSPSTSRPRPIVVRLARRAVRDQFVQAARVRRGATTEGTDLQGGLSGHSNRAVRVLGVPELPRGCMYEGRWFTEGSGVVTREACLKCACARGALSCRRRACAALPDPPPRRCHVLHKKGACCPELHCPDGVKLMEHGASARFENDDYSDIATPSSIIHACVEGGTVYSAGSAMGSRVACEQCFCLGGARRCVRPRCLPPPAGCRARPAPGACCPQRYYCDQLSTKPPAHKHVHDCQVNGDRIPEGERVVAAEINNNCTQCFCLRGAVRCQPLACAPPLLGCRPLLHPGQCCPHQYHCEHGHHGRKENIDSLVTPHIIPISDNAILSTRNDDRSFHTGRLVEPETTTKLIVTSSSTAKNTIAATNKEPITTTKVKRKTNDPPPSSTPKQPNPNTTTTTQQSTSTSQQEISKTTPTTKTETTTTELPPTTETLEKAFPTEQPEQTVKIMINGTINCTAELSSTSIPLNMSLNDTDRTKIEIHQRTPVNKAEIEAFTEYPNDIITDRSASGDFDENETFTINVTSSLRTNNSHSTASPNLSTTPKVATPIDIVDIVNTSKKSKGDYDYDYTEPTLPPSLPNLKIIPFVAADAVVEDDISSKDETLTYPMLEREDKFPVYYPSADTKEIPYATRREDIYTPTKYPVFVPEKADIPKYPPLTQNVDLPDVSYQNGHNDLTLPQHDYTISTAIGSNSPEVNNVVTKRPTTSSSFSVDTQSVNLFSPPVETEGGFIPKGPGIIEEYYAVYPSTPPGPPVPHLTTSMQLDITKGECVSGDGRHILEGDSISLACSICTCAWGELHCSPRPCPVPPGCSRRPATSSSADLCCGELLCDQGNKTTPKPNLLINIPTNDTSVPIKNSTLKPNEMSSMKPNITEESTTESNKTENFGAYTNSWNVSISKVDTTTELLKPPTSTDITTPSTKINTSSNIPEEDDYTDSEENEDEGFSFGNVLKLLLSDNYETTTTRPQKSTFIPKAPITIKITSTTPSTTTRLTPPKAPLLPFIPMPNPYIPPKKSYTQNSVNRIDHLVLGEATAIKKTTTRPVTASFKPIVSYKPVVKYTTTQRPWTTRATNTTRREETTSHRPAAHDVKPVSSALPLPGILKLAGCNIYGRMYRVGRIITELSTPCQECWCTELGVQCNSLKC